MTRRFAIAMAAASAAVTAAETAATLRGQTAAQPVKPPEAKRTLPTLCVLSGALTGVGYAEMGDIVKQLGFEGVDLTVMPGGTVEPSQAPVDEVRAFESVHGAGLQAPIITTALFTPADPWCRTVMALAGRTGVGLFKCGLNRRTNSIQAARNAYALAYLGREYKIELLLPAGGGTVDSDPAYDLKAAKAIAAVLDPQWSGISLNSDCFLGKDAVTDEQIRDVLPLVKSVSVADLDGPASGGTRDAEWRPLGKGSVDFGRMFATLARVGFTGPITVERNYKTNDEPGALSRDAEFVRKQIQTAYGNPKS